jgi:peptidoglycan hydrolase CwlO-like protein
MTNDEKIDEVLKIVKGHEARFDRLEGKLGLLEVEVNGNSQQITSLQAILLEDRQVNDARFSQMQKSIEDLREEVSKMNVNLSARIDLLSADMHGVSEELYETKRRVTRLEKKLLS